MNFNLYEIFFLIWLKYNFSIFKKLIKKKLRKNYIKKNKVLLFLKLENNDTWLKFYYKKVNGRDWSNGAFIEKVNNYKKKVWIYTIK